ncbi:hypothetical protein EV356DRAFT_568534 [Viridothelium virens]|uniref:PHD-type domain-containing protein n=1 Tax=Viridothelium virens TaxID=1048519 RepID=A0A6A6H421_VIRVR|nr:hypothetical protein EV356DRAFT_568534 [Viridothelium virens]
MADTCIVCLGDLAGAREESPPKPTLATDDELQVVRETTSLPTNGEDSSHAPKEDDETIAHLLPCGHNLHNACLKPWVERANSCPTCRASFNTVELSTIVGGPVWASYAVQDKQQAAEIDPSMIVDDDLFDGPIGPPCLVCEEIGDDETLLLCDGCEAACHVSCAGLQRVPRGPWYCDHCQEDDHVRIPPRQPSRITQRHRTRASQRRSRRTAADSWTRVWQSVMDRLHFDLDFPFDDDDDGPTQRQTEAERREFLEYQRRYEVAARQGGAQRFRAIAPTLLERNPENGDKGTDPSPESQEEIRAWNAFDKARELANGSQSNNRRKRKSTTASPVEPEPEAERKFKRPRTTRTNDSAPAINGDSPESSRAALNRGSAVIQRPRNLQLDSERATGGSNFLQSLLKEVESSHTPGVQQNTTGSPLPTSEPHHSPRPSSPDSSPTPSNHGTPRAVSTTPPPEQNARQSSPTPLTSSVLPVFPTVPEFSPFSPVNGTCDNPPLSDDGPTSRSRPLQRNGHRSPDSSPVRSKDTSPTRANMPFSTKQEIQKMVSTALKPRYKKQELNREQFTEINRDISRMLYDKVGDAGALSDQKDREHWQRIATEEVDNALKALNGVEVKAVASS